MKHRLKKGSGEEFYVSITLILDAIIYACVLQISVYAMKETTSDYKWGKASSAVEILTTKNDL